MGSYADAADTGEEWKWTCGGRACSAPKPAAPACGTAEGSCTSGTASAAADTLDPATERWSCSNGGETADCSAGADGCGTNETHALDGQGELECRCEAGHHRHNGACTTDPACNASPTDPADACTTGTYGATPADTYLDGACGTAANSCDAGTADESPADESPADAAAVDGACGTAVDGCAGGTHEDVDDTDAEHRWNCLGDDGAANWSCSGTVGDWNWSCTAGAQTLDSCTAQKTGTTATGCTSAVAADDAACSLCKTGHERCGGSCVAQCGANEVRNADTCACDCDSGHHRHDGACVADPECGGAADACAEGTPRTAADTMDPPTSRWSCASGAETAACEVPFSCGTNEAAELDGSDELRCACADGHHRHNGACAADPACNASPTDTADACTPGTYGEAPADTYEDGACGTAANSCGAGSADESPTDSPAVDGACGTEVNACGDGSTLKEVDDTDAEHLWECIGQDGVANWNCTGTAGDWNWSCTSGAQTLGSCTAPKSGTTATGCSAVVEAHDDVCRICRAGYTMVGGVCRQDCDAASKDRCTLGLTTSGGSSGTCDQAGTCHYLCEDGVWTRTEYSCRDYARCVGEAVAWTVNGQRCEAALAEIPHGASGTATDNAGAVTGKAKYSCNDGDRTRTSATCGRECAAGTRSWTVNGQTCSAWLAKAAHGGRLAATDASYSETGSATFSCADGTWTEQPGSTCRAGCGAATFGSGEGYICSVGDTVHGGTGGGCDQAETCSYRCGDGSWTRTEKSCRPFRDCDARDVSWTVDSQTCRGTTRETDHGGNSGASDGSGTVTGSASFSCYDGGWTVEAVASCGRECAAGTRTWMVNGQTCSAHAPKAAHGGRSRASDGTGTVTGSASFLCHNGGWTVEAGATCGRECAAETKTWTAGGRTCSADVPKTPHLGAPTATDDTYPASGSATFTCSDGVWSAPTGATCNAGCPNTHVGDKGSKCSRTDTLHGSSDGSCDEDGVCSYECDNGRWNETSNGCHPWDKCLADPDHEWTVGTRACQGALPEIAHGARGGATDGTPTVTGSVTYSCDDGNRTEVSKTCGRECAAETKTWTAGGRTCSADVPKTPHLGAPTATDDTYPASGSATFTCSDGVWSAPTGATCNAGCPNTHVGDKGSKCSRTDTLHGSSDGSCDEDGVCSYECDNGRWNETSNGCHPWDKCLADPDHEWTVGTRACQGALPEIAHGARGGATDGTPTVTGSVTYSCDDGNRTEVSKTCGRECAAETKTWTAGGRTCSADVPKTPHLGAPTATDDTYPASGSATFTCSDGVWSAPTGATCNAGCPNTHVGDKGSKCSRTDTLHGSSDGSCDEDGVCSYECDNGRWNETSNGCHPWDKCLADPDHEWTVGTRACQGALPEIAHGAEGRADDDRSPR